MQILLAHLQGFLISHCQFNNSQQRKLLQARKILSHFVFTQELNCIHLKIYFDIVNTLNKLFYQRMMFEIII